MEAMGVIFRVRHGGHRGSRLGMEAMGVRVRVRHGGHWG